MFLFLPLLRTLRRCRRKLFRSRCSRQTLLWPPSASYLVCSQSVHRCDQRAAITIPMFCNEKSTSRQQPFDGIGRRLVIRALTAGERLIRTRECQSFRLSWTSVKRQSSSSQQAQKMHGKCERRFRPSKTSSNYMLATREHGCRMVSHTFWPCAVMGLGFAV